MDGSIEYKQQWIIEDAKKSIKHYQNIIEEAEAEIKKSEWMNGKDRMEIQSRLNDRFFMHCNCLSWKVAKDLYGAGKDTMFFLGISNASGGGEIQSHIGLSTKEAKQLRDYLSQKIEYLES